MAVMFKGSKKIFGRDGDDHAFQSEDALCFLQSIISNDSTQTFKYQAGEEFKLSDLKAATRNAQEWLENQEEYNEKEKRKKIKELDISKKNLEGLLILKDFTNLEVLNCAYNQLTSLDLSNCSKLKILNCSFNKLTKLDCTNLEELERIECCDNYLDNFDYSSLNPEKLTLLNITDNNLPEQDLSVFSRFTNLQLL